MTWFIFFAHALLWVWLTCVCKMCRATGLSEKYCSEVEKKARAYVLWFTHNWIQNGVKPPHFTEPINEEKHISSINVILYDSTAHSIVLWAFDHSYVRVLVAYGISEWLFEWKHVANTKQQNKVTFWDTTTSSQTHWRDRRLGPIFSFYFG